MIAADPHAFAAAFRDASGDKVDEVRYANDGDRGQRVREPEVSFRHHGWAWTASCSMRGSIAGIDQTLSG